MTNPLLSDAPLPAFGAIDASHVESANGRTASEESGGPLRVVIFNIEYGREIDGAIRLIQATEALRNPDILLLQEMSSAGVVRIAAGLGLNYLYYPSGIHPQARQEYGTAILSPWRLEEPQKLLLPHGAAVTGMRRAVTIATVLWRAFRFACSRSTCPGPCPSTKPSDANRCSASSKPQAGRPAP